MTTIVYDHKNKQVALDSRITAGNLIVTDEGSKHTEKDGEHWFFCGETSDYDQLIELAHNDKPEVLPDCSAIMVKGGVAWLVAFNGEYCSHSKMQASRGIGSGGEFAMCALDFGKTAKEAVEYAITRDSGTGGKVHVYDIDKGEFV